jgi:putative ABC transport system permease protein
MVEVMKKGSHISPPRLANRLLCWFIKDELAEEVLGDLDEQFSRVLAQGSEKKARRNYWYQVIQYIRPFALRKSKLLSINNNGMFQHYIKISWRNLVRHKVFSGIKIGGFAIGIAACILIALFIRHETSYDQHYKDSDRIFRLANQYSSAGDFGRWTNVQGPFKPVIEEHIPDIEQVGRVVLWKWGNVGENHVRALESRQNIYEEGFFYADPEVLEILEIPMVLGTNSEALDAPDRIVISKSKAGKFFPNENPMGRQLVLNDNPDLTYTIGGVMEDFPLNSHLQGDFIMTLKGRTTGPGSSGWCCSNYDFYVKLSENANKSTVEDKLVAIRDTYVVDELKAAGNDDIEEIQKYQSYYLQPVEHIYLNQEEIGDHISHGSIYSVWIFGAIAIVILLLASINFINLSTAKSIKRAREVGMRKVVGSVKSSLIQQFLSESVFFSILSTVIGLGLAYLVLPTFNQIADKSLIIPITSVPFIAILLSAAIVIGLISGVYPAFYLSQFKPITVLKGNMTSGKKATALRSGMVVFQFTATVILIVGAMVTHQQFDHYMNKSLGYEKDQVVNILGLNSLEPQQRDLFKEALLNHSGIASASLTDYLPVAGSRITNFGFRPEDQIDFDAGFEAARWIVDEDYLNTMSMKLIAGRNFREEMQEENSLIINQTMAEAFNLEETLGTQVIDMFNGRYQVIGVVEDFYFESLTDHIRPLAMVRGKGSSTLSVKLSTQDVDAVMTQITATWDDIQPNQPIRYRFMDERFADMYSSLDRAKTLFIGFSVLSIVVACLGLFALSAYSVEQRSKEVSIRKVLGANTDTIFILLAKDFMKLVGLAIVLAVPIGWYFMNGLLEDLANRVALSWQVFAVGALIALVIAFLTISAESLRAAFANPAAKLRSE